MKEKHYMWRSLHGMRYHLHDLSREIDKCFYSLRHLFKDEIADLEDARATALKLEAIDLVNDMLKTDNRRYVTGWNDAICMISAIAIRHNNFFILELAKGKRLPEDTPFIEKMKKLLEETKAFDVDFLKLIAEKTIDNQWPYGRMTANNEWSAEDLEDEDVY